MLVPGKFSRYMRSKFHEFLQFDIACVHCSTNGTNDIPISFKVLPMVQLVMPLVPMVPLVKTVGSQYCRQSSVGKITHT